MRIKQLLLLAALLLSVCTNAESLRDPTAPLFQRTVSQGGVTLSLSAIIDGDGYRFAIVNDRRCVEGDEIGGAKIIEIQGNAIVYEYKNKQHTLKMRESVIN